MEKPRLYHTDFSSISGAVAILILFVMPLVFTFDIPLEPFWFRYLFPLAMILVALWAFLTSPHKLTVSDEGLSIYLWLGLKLNYSWAEVTGISDSFALVGRMASISTKLLTFRIVSTGMSNYKDLILDVQGTKARQASK